MRKLYLLLFTILTVFICRAQHVGLYGNEWIDYTQGQMYYKIKIRNDGFYRVPYSTLKAANPEIDSIHPADFVLFHNGEKVAINVSTVSPTVFDSTGFIEFYGKRNIGDVDSNLYPQPGFQPNTYYSLFSDTSIYFLTTKTGGNNFHYQYINNDTASIPSLTEEQYFWFPIKWYYGVSGTSPGSGAKFSGGTPYNVGGDYFSKSLYDQDEAWGGGWINTSNSPQTLPISTPSIYTTGPPAIIAGVMFTKSFERHCFTIKLNGTIINSWNFDNTNGGFSHNPFSDTIALSSLSSTTANQIPFQELCASSTQSNLLMNITISYPRKYDFGSVAQFYWRMQQGSGSRYFRINNVTTTTTQPLLYDITNGYIIRSTDAPGILPKKFVLPPSGGERELFFRNDIATTLTVVNRIDTITFRNYGAAGAQSVHMIVTHKSLRNDGSGYDPVQDYATYRSGRYTSYVYDIDQIINQFGYGVQKSPLALRNFVEYAYDKWTRKPEYLFIVGKGRDYVDARTSSYAYDHDLITPFGNYPSDNLLACRRGSNRPLVAVGRLAAQTPTDVTNYLAKMRVYEGQQNDFGDPYQTKQKKLWMKQIMHFSGGTSSSEQADLASYLDNFATTAKDTSWGANVFTIYKTVSAPVDNSEADIIRARIDSGVSLMTFFGHASGTTFDISIDNPANFNNYDKYPIIYSNGCLAGDISSEGSTATPPLPSYSESSVLTPGKCAIAFTATSNVSLSSSLADYGNFAYHAACQYAYDKPWGKALQLAQIATDSVNGGDDFSMMVAYEMTLHGDPALSLNQYPIPDYQIDQSSLFFNPQTVDASMDSFYVNVIVTNLGKAIKDSIQITLSRSYPQPNNPGLDTTITYKWKVKAPYYIDTTFIKIPTFPTLNAGYGQNQFSVFVESERRINELSETNNGDQVTFGLQILSDDILPVYPYEYAIVPTQNITLKASTVDPFSPLKNYRIQIDTSELFRHPLGQSSIYQTGGVLHWTVPFQFRDSTVYYWRVSRDSINDTTSYRWHYSSFVYIKNEYPGWNQSHYYQYTHDNYDDSIYIASDRVFKFKPVKYNIVVQAGWSNAAGNPVAIPFSEVKWSLNSIQQYDYRMGGCGYAYPAANSGFTFAVIDTATGQPWISYNRPGTNRGQFGNIHCDAKPDPQNGFDFPVNTQAWADTILKFLDSIPNGSVIVMYSVSLPDWRNLNTSLYNRLLSMGATGLTSLKSGAHAPAPYIFFTVKGNPSKSKQYTGFDYTTVTVGEYNFQTLNNQGTVLSPLIGPSTGWGSFHWRHRSREVHTSDQQRVDVIGVASSGQSFNLLSTTALDTAIAFINSTQYPYIRLKLNTEDDTTHTPTQLYYWRVLYKTVAEAAINPAAHFVFQKDTVNLGDILNVEVALENISDLPMDSMRTAYTIRNLNGTPITSSIVKSDSLRVGQTQILKFRQPITTSSYSGKNRLVIEANPVDALHQPEQYHFNNYAFIDFNGVSDKINPLLDVTFDGRRIVNNDLISAKPDILISMKDENKSLALNDTSLAQVYIRYPGQTIPALINYDNSTLTFYPATGNIAKNNQAKIEFKPSFNMDGQYDLLVRDKDRSGNFSSNTTNRYEGSTINGVYYDYKISFNIITKSMITNVLNYPNPFTTRTQFVFTLTGSEVPDYMKIQIMTITGKVVKEVQRAELGNIHIGVNRTDYYWDGRDEYGDKLANGVYFYRVITKIDDKNVDHMSSNQYGQFFNNTNIDKYFKHGFGKMVIMR